MYAEFDALGEAEVTRRVENGAYDGVQRVYAFRWLNARGLARSSAAAVRAFSRDRRQYEIGRERRRAAFAYMVLAAAIAAMVAAGGAYQISHQHHGWELFPAPPAHPAHGR